MTMYVLYDHLRWLLTGGEKFSTGQVRGKSNVIWQGCTESAVKLSISSTLRTVVEASGGLLRKGPVEYSDKRLPT